MKVVIRADASVSIGSGHIMRCLTLAEALREQGAVVIFVCRDLSGNCCNLVEEDDFKVFRLPGDGDVNARRDAELTLECFSGRRPDWLVVDNYGIDVEWERQQRPFVGRIMVIDDMADRNHDCDALLDQNFIDGMEHRYDGLIPDYCQQFIGPRYALLRNEFITARKTVRERNGRIRRILVFFGGSDPTNETEKTLHAIRLLNRRDIAFDVIVGAANSNAAKIEATCTGMQNVAFHRQVKHMAELMVNADLAVGAGGTTTWERCFLGLPSLVIIVADNQASPSQAADNAGIVRLVGESAHVSVDALSSVLAETLSQNAALSEMTKRCLSFMGERATSIHEDILTCMYEGIDAP